MLKCFACIAIFFLGSISFGQKLLGVPAYTTHAYVNYENDLFARTDRYYTQGIDLGINRFVAKKESSMKFQRYELSQNVYTPSSIKSDSLLLNDRPYAATLSGKYEYGMIRTVAFSYLFGAELGVVGPIAGGKQMQTGIHKATNNFLPLGWQHQISNGLLVDVYGKVEKRIFRVDRLFQLIAGASARIGAFQTNFTPSISMIIGNRKAGKVSLLFENSLCALVYDGTLQGSLISSKSEYRLHFNDVEHFILKSELSLRVRLNNVGIIFSYALQSKTFVDQLANVHAWGGICLVYTY